MNKIIGRLIQKGNTSVAVQTTEEFDWNKLLGNEVTEED
jgi:hypothetical protein